MSLRLLRLDSGDDSLLLCSADEGLPEVIYWGRRLPLDEDPAMLLAAWRAPLPHGGLDQPEPPAWLPEAGRGFTGTPALQLRRAGRRCLTQCRVEAVQAAPASLCIHAVDAQAGVRLTLALDALHGGYRAQVRLHNVGADALEVDQLASLCLPVPAGVAELLHTGGSWAQEFQARRSPLGAWQQQARTGRSSHHAHPSLALLGAGCTAQAGEAWGLQLAWSANHEWRVEPLRQGGHLLSVGELLLPGEVVLQPGQRHSGPALWLRRGSAGLRGLACAWQDLVRALLPPQPPGRRRRVQCNTWEACYFDHDEARSLALAESAAAVGVERFVLDDGWFAGRRHERAGLGDWWPCPERYPRGLAPLAARCRALGMAFGLWVEPESVSADSDLYCAHPDWVLHAPGRVQPLGRWQYVLDLGRPEVRGHLFERLDTLLRDTGADYLKWDMNRDFTHEHGADGRPGVRAHVLGLYDLLARLREAHPGVEIEACASGGGRADLGALALQRRVWLSDCNDPLERQPMQAAFLQWLPAEIMGSHIGPEVSHTTGRSALLALRSLNAVFGSLGLELDLLALCPAGLAALREQLAAYKQLRDLLGEAHVTALDSPDASTQLLWAVRQDRTAAWLSVVALGRAPSAIPPLLRLPGLSEGEAYRLSWHPLWSPPRRPVKREATAADATGPVLSGAALARHGLRLPVLWPGDGCLLQLRLMPG